MNLTYVACTMIRSRLESGGMGVWVSDSAEAPFSGGGGLATGFFRICLMLHDER